MGKKNTHLVYRKVSFTVNIKSKNCKGEQTIVGGRNAYNN